MKVRVWEYDVPAGQRARFEQVYGPEGAWAVLFGRSEGFLGTELYADLARPGHYLTIDRFVDEEAWQSFRLEHHAEYERLGAHNADLTESQNELV